MKKVKETCLSLGQMRTRERSNRRGCALSKGEDLGEADLNGWWELAVIFS